MQIKRPESTLDPAACPFCVETNFGIIYYPPNSSEFKARYGDVGRGGGDTPSDAISIRSGTSNGGLSELGMSPSPGADSFLQISPEQTDASVAAENEKIEPVKAAGRRKSLNHSFPGVVTTGMSHELLSVLIKAHYAQV